MLNNTVDRYFTQEQILILIFLAGRRAQSTTVLPPADYFIEYYVRYPNRQTTNP